MSVITGKAKRYDGSPIDYVLLFDWATGDCIGNAVPDAQGNWSYTHFTNLNCGITYVSDGCEPITHGAYSFVVEWSPHSLFTGQQGAWYDPSDLTTLYQDASGLNPVTKDGQGVALMKDKSGNNNHMVQSTASARPVYRSSGGKQWLEFDGIDDYMEVLTTRFKTPSVMSVASELLSFTSDLATVFGDGYLGASRGYGYFLGRSPNFAYTQYRNLGNLVQIEIARPNGVHVATSSVELQAVSLMINNQLPTTASHTVGAITSDQPLLLGARKSVDGVGFFANVNFFGGMLREGGMTESDRLALVDYLATTSGAII